MSAARPQPALESEIPARQGRRPVASWMHLGGQVLTPAVVFLSLWISVRLRGLAFTGQYEALAIVGCLVCAVVFQGVGINHAKWRAGGLLDLGSLLVAWTASTCVLLALGYFTKFTAMYSRVALTTWFVLGSILLCTAHLLLWSYFDKLRRRGVGVVSAVIGPMTPAARRLVTAFQSDAALGVRLLGYFGSPGIAGVEDLPCLGALSDLPRYVSLGEVGAAYISLEQSSGELPQLLEALQGGRASVFLIPNVFAFDLLQSELHSVDGIPVLSVGSVEPGILGGLAKRAIDLCGSAAALVALSPLIALAAIAIKFDSPGPVIFRQKRCGMHNEEITVWKFRSMWVDAVASTKMQAVVPGDPRVTRVGAWLRKTSLDELPQLWNVLCGKMSLVGPRPHALPFNDQYRGECRGYMLRHKVRPGITGWAQVNGCRGDIGVQGEIQRRLDYDLEYIRRWSVVLDVWILLRTVPAVWLNRNVY